VLPELIDNDYIESQAKLVYDQTKARFDGSDMIQCSHILLLVKQDAGDDVDRAKKAQIDSIYNALMQGADFAELAKQYSDDKGSAVKGGELPEANKGMFVPEFENQAYALKTGEISKPFKSPYGYHIIKMRDRHPFESYEFHHDNIIKFLEQRGIKEASAQMHLDSLVKTSGKSREEVVQDIATELESKDKDLYYLSKEYNDGTLMFAISKRDVWDKAAKDEAGLEKYFKKNKKNYQWDQPHYRGIVVHAKSDSIANAAKTLVAGIKNEDDWAKSVVAAFNNDSVRQVRVEHGIYKKGDNPYVDHAIYGGAEKSMNNYPATAVMGKMLKKPESYKDVKGQVTSDYQSEKEKEWVEQLKKKYPVKIYQEVVDTVNKH